MLNSIYGAVVITLLIICPVFIYIIKNKQKNTRQSSIMSQSMLHYRYNYSKKYSRKLKIKTQSMNHYNDSNIKVIIFDNEAYWIRGNVFYKAPITDNHIDKDSTQQVDTISMDKVQLEKMLFIMDKLREGANDDRRGSGDEQF